ncbi:hypothetical protein LCGC14_2725380 [marine sediment metagenome]|uniref:Uncharacterized protein n=1 Tax=marine sediment metagenome TaxID=412755 RepID=A0A0F9BHW5_9ZZZZ
MQPSPIRKLPFAKEQDGMEIARVVNMLIDGYVANVLRLPKRTAAPTGNDVYEGAVAYADGSGWNPGAGGEGAYMYYNSTWNRLG